MLFAGIFRFFSVSETIIDAKEMIYSFVLTSTSNEAYTFLGKKIIKAEQFGETGLTDCTTLFTNIYKGTEDAKTILATGVIKISFSDFSKQLQTLEVINTESAMEKIKWTTKFGKFFASSIWSTYSGFAECKYLDPNAPPRKRRLLRTGGVVPVTYKVITEDKVSFLIIERNSTYLFFVIIILMSFYTR